MIIVIIKGRDQGMKSFVETKASVKNKTFIEQMNNKAKAVFLHCGNGFNPNDFKVNLYFL